MRRIIGETHTQTGAVSTTTVTRETTTRVTQTSGETVRSRVAPMEGSGSLLDEATKARLSQVLDEIISVSVRKAVREEMPRLMEQMARE